MKQEMTRRHHDCFSKQEGTKMLTSVCNIARLKVWRPERFPLALGVWFFSALMLLSVFGVSPPAFAANGVAPAPRIIPTITGSAGVSSNLGVLSDNRGWNGTSVDIPSNGTVTFELRQTPTRILFQWMGGGFNYTTQGPTRYEIRVSSDGINFTLADLGLNSQGQPKNPVTNQWLARSHVITGNNIGWIRFVNTGGAASIAEFDIHDLSLCHPGVACDTWGFIGDSITAASYARERNSGEAFNRLVPGRTPSMLNMGIGSLQSGNDSVVGLRTWLPRFLEHNDGIHFWAIGIGTNNAGWGAMNATATNQFRLDLIELVGMLRAAGKQPIIAQIPFSANVPNSVSEWNGIIRTLTQDLGLPTGPDMYTYFRDNPGELRADGVHIDGPVGREAMNRLWAGVAIDIDKSSGVGSTVTITGGNVTATGGGDNAAGIGGDNVLIYGEATRVTATGSGTAQDIAAGNVFVSLMLGNLTLSTPPKSVSFTADPAPSATGTVTATLPVFGSINLLNGLTTAKNQSVIARFGAADNIAFALPGYTADSSSPTTGAGLMAAGARVRFVQNSVYGISHNVTPVPYIFSPASPGYGTQNPLNVTVTNTGSQATGALTVALSGANTTAFTLSTGTISSITSTNGTANFTVRPNTGLALGTYTATVTISGANSISESFGVSFTVRNITGPHVVSVSPSGTGVALSGTIAITFSEPMNTADFSRTVSLTGGVSTLTNDWWSNNNTTYNRNYSGLAEGTTYTVNIAGFIGATSGTMTPDNSHSFTTLGGTPTHTISTNAGAGGSISPTSVQVNLGATHTFTVTPNEGYYISSISGCNGSSVTGGSAFTSAHSYTTGAITGACTVSATFTASPVPVAFQGAVSRKVHGGAGTFDLPIRADGSTVEPRSAGPNRAFEVVFRFNAGVNSASATLTGAGTVANTTINVSSNEVVVNLTNVPDGTRLEITLTVNGTANAASASIGFLFGDENQDHQVDVNDVLAVLTQSGQMANATNYLRDVDADGQIDVGDIIAALTQAGRSLP